MAKNGPSVQPAYQTADDVGRLIARRGLPDFMRDVMRRIEEGFKDFSDGRIEHQRRVGFLFGGNTVEAMPARRVGKHIVFKVVNFHKPIKGKRVPSVMSTSICLDEATGAPIAIIDSTTLTAIRTGAISGLAIKHLFPEAKSIGLIGAGIAGRASLQAACVAIKPDRLLVHDFKDSAISDLNWALSGFEHPAITSADPETLVRESDVVIACTYGDQVVVKKEWIDAGAKKLIISVGSDTPGKCEVEPSLYRDATIVTDYKEQAMAEGDIELPIKQGIITGDDIAAELYEIISGKQLTYRPITIFDSTGDPVSDLIMAEAALSTL